MAPPPPSAARLRFGAQPEDGGTRFGLWAPGCDAVSLELVDAQGALLQRCAMVRTADGFHGAQVPGLEAGALYRFRVRGDLAVPDPASRRNPQGVHGPSEVVDLRPSPRRAHGWTGRPWHEAVVYELHVGTFTPEGTLAAAAAHLPALQALGITAVELMPLAAFSGRRGWGYDGVLPFAVHAPYGTPQDLLAFVDAAHGLGLMVLLDVVYNHFGPDGNYLAAYCPEFVNPAHRTPWGSALDFDGPHSAAVRRFFVENALHWVQACGLDGLRLDAVHALVDDSAQHVVEEIGAALRDGPGRDRHVHLVLENERNAARLLARRGDAGSGLAQWNDDWHHAAHVLATGETDGYYADFAAAAGGGLAAEASSPAAPADAFAEPAALLARSLAEGFIYQGQPSAFAHGEPRGEPSAHLPPAAFVNFLQNHDQVGNRALGERLDALAPPAKVEALLACLLLAPQVPMLFMGEEFAAATPFLYFCDYEGGLASAVTEGRRNEFARFAAFADPAARDRIPDPNAAATFEASTLRWGERQAPSGRRRLGLVAELLAVRRGHLQPLLPQMRRGGRWQAEGRTIDVAWQADDGSVWHLHVHLGGGPAEWPLAPGEKPVYQLGAHADAGRCRFEGPGLLAAIEPAVRAAGE